MGFCISKPSEVYSDTEKIFEHQADALDELLSDGLLQSESVDALICLEKDLLRASETDDAEDEDAAEDAPTGLAESSEDQSANRKEQTIRSSGSLEAGEDDLFQEDLVSFYLQEISRYPLLTPEREIELAKAIKEGQEKLVDLVWDRRAAGAQFQEHRRQLLKWQEESVSYPGLREKMVNLALEVLEDAAGEPGATEGQRDLHAGAQEIAARVDAAKNEMVEGNLRLVLSIAKRYRGRGLSFLDLIQEGNMGLLKAVARYDYTKGNRFSTYATWWVRQSIIRGIYDKTRTIRLPVHFIEMKSFFFKIFYELVKELGREPTPMEIAEHSGLSLDKVMMIIQLSSRPLSFESSLGSEDQRLGDFIADEGAVSPLERVSEQELVEITHEVLASLSSREETILKSRFGIDGKPTETLKTIGEHFSVSKERIRQIEKKAIRKLRHTPRREQLKCFLE